MTQPAEAITKFLKVTDGAGTAVTGLTAAAFAFVAFTKPYAAAAAAYAHGSTITELTGGWYAWTFTAASLPGHTAVDIALVSTSNSLRFAACSGETEGHDLASIYALVALPRVTLSPAGSIGQRVPVTVVAGRRITLRFSFVDFTAAPIDMTVGGTYTAYTFGVRTLGDQRTTGTGLPAANIDCVAGSPTGFAVNAGLGFVDVVIPETAPFLALAEAAAPDPDGKRDDLRFELTADLVAAAGQTVSLVPSSPLTVIRREVGAA